MCDPQFEALTPSMRACVILNYVLTQRFDLNDQYGWLSYIDTTKIRDAWREILREKMKIEEATLQKTGTAMFERIRQMKKLNRSDMDTLMEKSFEFKNQLSN